MKESIKEKQLKEVDVIIDGKIICDYCRKVILQKSMINTLEYGNSYKWFHMITGHRDWGNDSIDSMETFDLCSRECLMNKMNEIMDEYNDSYTDYYDIEARGFTYYRQSEEIFDRLF